MSTFKYIWSLLEPDEKYNPVKRRCQLLWDSFPIEKQRDIYNAIRQKKKERKFLDYNPLFAIEKNANPPKPKAQKLTFGQYYERFGTTEEQDGWKRVYLPEEQKTIYTKD